MIEIKHMRTGEVLKTVEVLCLCEADLRRANLCAADLPKSRVKEYGFGRYLWMLYGTKQGRENHYKTPLEDFGLHHPPSGRLGINQVFYTLAVAASNLAMVIRYRVAKGEDRGITFWRFRERYVRLAGLLVRGARTLTARLFGAGLEARFQALWSAAFAEAALL